MPPMVTPLSAPDALDARGTENRVRHLLGVGSSNALLLLSLAAGLAAGAEASGDSYKYPHLMGYRSFLPELEETASFARMGIPLRTVFIANTVSANGRQYCQYPPVWRGMGDYDFAPVDAQLGDIIKASPNAEFSIFLDLNTPVWLTRRVHHDSYNEITHALSSPIYREEASNYLDKLVRYIEENYGDRVKSYSILCGYTSEWFERNLRQSHVKNLAWRKWCSERGLKYGLSTPTESDLATAAFEGTIYDPATEQVKIDFWKFHSWIISEGVLHFSHIVKKVAPGKPVGADYGYYMICDKDPGGVGNLDYERVVADPGFDCILSPATYSGREIGGGTGSMLVVGTCRRYGKRFYYSVDQWPHSLKNEYGSNYFKTMADTLAGNTRNAAFALVHHANFHWFDMWGGFYKDPEMKERISKIAAIQRRFADDDSVPAADVLIVADPDSAYGRIDPRMAANDELGPKKGARCPEGFVPAYGCGEEFRNRINHVGVVYDVVSFNDIPHIDMANRLFVLQPLAEIAEMIRGVKFDRLKRGVKRQLLLHSDASQALNLLDINVARLGVDLLTLNAAKVYGPKGVGALYVAHGVKLKPLVAGGGQENGLRSGTENVPGVIGFAKAVELAKEHLNGNRKKYAAWRKILLSELKDYELINKKHCLDSFVVVCFRGLDAERLIYLLEDKEIYVSTGAACAASKGVKSHVLKAIGLSDEEIAGSLRLTLGETNDEEQIREAARAINEVVISERERLKNA